MGRSAHSGLNNLARNKTTVTNGAPLDSFMQHTPYYEMLTSAPPMLRLGTGGLKKVIVNTGYTHSIDCYGIKSRSLTSLRTK